MVPVRCLQLILVIFVYHYPLLVAVANEIAIVIGVIASVESAHAEICCAHLVLFCANIEPLVRRTVTRVLLLSH